MNESPRTYDLVVIGGGPAGVLGAATAAVFGKRVALIDSRPELGGAGVNTGTVPSKTLRETALALSGMKSRQLYGVDLSLRREATVADFMRRERLSSQAREQLIRLKTRTGVAQWNILCRWALCLSLREPTPPSPVDIPADSNVEMTWHVFGGEHHELYLALVIERCEIDGLGTSDEVVARQFRLHLHRGISYLATPGKIRSIGDLIGLIASLPEKSSHK
jgi:DNA sulfur modification protein DndE